MQRIFYFHVAGGYFKNFFFNSKAGDKGYRLVQLSSKSEQLLGCYFKSQLGQFLARNSN
jgi:hypothetical protein